MPAPRELLLLALSLPLTLPSPAHAQKDPTQQLVTGRSFYYTPTVAGLDTMHCDLAFDWRGFMAQIAGKTVGDDDPSVKYMAGVHLAVDDSLRGRGTLVWRESAPPPDAIKSGMERAHSGLSQMIGGFFQTWNQFMNGSMVPAPDASTTVTATPTGLHMHATAEGTVADEDFGPNVLLTSAHVTMPSIDVTIAPTYTDTPEGRIVSSIATEYRQPPTSPPVKMVLDIEYQQVSGFRIPSMMRANVQNQGTFIFHFSNCTVGKASTP